MSFPTPAAIPQAPARDYGHGKGARPLLLGVAGLIAVASVGAIVFAMRAGPRPSKEVVFDPGTTPPPVTSLTGSGPAPGDSAEKSVPAAAGGTDVPPLRGAGGPTATSVTHGPPHSAAPQHTATTPAALPSQTPQAQTAAPSVPPAQPTVLPPAIPVPAPVSTPATAPRPAARYDGPECVSARRLRAIGHPREAEGLALACIAKGGIP